MKRNASLSRRSFVKGAVAAGFSFTALGQLVGCGSSDGVSGGGSAQSRERLTILFNDAPTSLDPAVGWDGWYAVCRGITETLVQFDENMDLRECLAVKWGMDDDTTWRFTLREGVTFQTGNPLTAEAAKASIERTIGLNTRAADKLKVASIETDGNDLIIKSTQTIATMPGELAEPVFSIVDTTTADEAPETSGTGPFMGKEITSMENFLLTRFEGYWNGCPTVVELDNQTVTEPSARTIALQSGDTDVAWSIQASDLQLFRDNQAFNLVECESVRMVFAYLNYRNEHLAVREVRQALSFAADRSSICDKLLVGSVVENGTLFPSYLSYSEAVADRAQAYDIDKARDLLEQAGYVQNASGDLAKGGEALALRIAYYESRPELPIIAQALQDQFGQLGIQVELSLYENIDELFHSDGFDVMLYNTTTVANGDPSYFLQFYYETGASENAGDYSNEQADALIEAMRRELDQDKRFELAAEVQKIILDDCPNIFFGSPIMNLVETAQTKGFVLYPVEYYGVTHEIA